uniref:Uncharacterized protein n=1 Tax=Faecalibaculum rodentium TaxID=1702221 RepID=A0A140DYQ9_9FIRM|nr:hypothetical protein AALO17_26520 [Faecalibaculum rodentium]
MLEENYFEPCWYRLNSEQRQGVTNACHKLESTRKKLSELE